MGDVFSMHGVGIACLEEKLAPFTPDKNDFLDDPHDTIDALIRAYEMADKEYTKFVKCEQGMIDYNEEEEDAPGTVLYVPQTVIDVLSMSDSDIRGKVHGMLEFIITNAKSDNGKINHVLDSLRNNLVSIKSIDVADINAEGAFY